MSEEARARKNAAQRAYYATNRDAIRAIEDAKLLDPERRKVKNERQNEYYWRNRDAIRARILASRTPEVKARRARYMRENFGRSLGLSEQELRTVIAQKHCDICGREKKKMVIDHCHESGLFRGVLCSQCNTAIGLLEENVEAILSAVAYIEKHLPKKRTA